MESLMTEPPAAGTRTTSRNTWKWFLALEAVFALVYFPFGVTPGKPLIFGVLPWMEWPGQVAAWAMLGLSSVAAIIYGVRRNRPNAPVAWWFIGVGRLPLHHRRHHLQVLAPDHGSAEHSVPVVHRRHLHHHVPDARHRPSPAGPQAGAGRRQRQPSRRPHDHPGRRAPVMDLSHRPQCPLVGHGPRPPDRRRLPVGRRARSGHVGAPVEQWRIPAHCGTAAGHRDRGNAGLGLPVRVGQPPYERQLVRRQRHRPGVDPLLRLLGRGGSTSFDPRALGTEGGARTHRPVPAAAAGGRVTHRPGRPAR